MDKLNEVPLREDHLNQRIKISAELKKTLRGQILALLQQYVDVFAWIAQDMPGVDSKVMTHRLGIRLGF